MNAARLPYRQTGTFSSIALDYIDQAAALKPFFTHPPTLQGIQKAIEARKQFATDRKTLVAELKKQYEGVETSDNVKKSIESLLSADTFTITTAHQNNLFTGPLYFIYKIVHAIKLVDHLKTSLPKQNFIPVFYIGSEDADLAELNHINLGGEKLAWETKQTGAVGRMKIDKGLLKLVDRIEGQLSVLPNGNEIVSLLKGFYKEGVTIQDATFYFVNKLFAEYGLVVLLPDNTALKKQMVDLFKDDLLNQTASGIVEKTVDRLGSAGYKSQANPREINLFYLKDDLRERIEKKNDKFTIHNSPLTFSENDLLKELNDHPERFSPNVILRGLYQETILPNIAFIGGAGETAYWLQLKDLFDHYTIPFPVLVLRNSFLIVEKKWQEKMAHLGFTIEDFFLPEQELLNKLVTRESKNETKLNGSLTELEQLYDTFKKQAAAVDTTLEKHVMALKQQTVYRLQELEKKMLRAEKRKFADQQRQIHTIKEHLFPGNGLQERHENLSYYYAKWGKDFIKELYQHSLGLEQEFVTIKES
ncbi:MAG: bacillithiol biosynthesis cysteine-adding enzyme BshC [Chitinophagaceae bacterium]|nr:bacillithiol biosynthesis cysteine-adding enzyme BshC [Chitinophagaceae bacterium]